jgi:Glycosyl transferase family 2
MSADGLWSIHLQNCRLFGPALGMRRAEALPAWPLSSSHKVVPHRRLLMRAVASDIFDADQSMVPKLSIGVPVFNGQELLPELLDSLLAQTFRDFDILICNNASTG